MEPDSNNRSIVPFEGQTNMLPATIPGRTLEIPARKKSSLAKLSSWLVAHPAARFGLATAAFAAGRYLSRRMPAERRQTPSRIQRGESAVEEWSVTGIELSIHSDCEHVSVWSITRFYLRR